MIRPIAGVEALAEAYQNVMELVEEQNAKSTLTPSDIADWSVGAALAAHVAKDTAQAALLLLPFFSVFSKLLVLRFHPSIFWKISKFFENCERSKIPN